MKKTISVARDFSVYPSGRYSEDGDYSGEQFRDEFLIPALHEFDTVEVFLDGTIGYSSAFLEETFGGLVRKGYKPEVLIKKLVLISERQGLKDEINHHIISAKQ